MGIFDDGEDDDDFEGFEEGDGFDVGFEIEPAVVITTALQNAAAANLTLADVIDAVNVSTDTTDELFEGEDLDYRFDCAVNASMWLRHTVKKFYTKTVTEESN